jgi:hypothetical protein
MSENILKFEKKRIETTLIGIDSGSTSSGIIVVTENGIREGYNILNTDVFSFIHNEYSKCINLKIIIEDVKPYNMRITNGIIDTIKFIGQIEWRVRQLVGVRVELIPRWQIKQWVFVQFKTMVLPEIEKKIDRWASKEENEGRNRKTAQFVWVDDRMIANAMRKHWNIPKKEKIGAVTPFNLKDHSWQALALVSYFMATK